jgi:hypothetical protein
MFQSLRLLAAVAALAAPSLAQLTPIGPFTGTHFEGFETQDTSGGAFPPCIVDRVFGGEGDLCSSTAGAHITGGWGFGCTIQEHSGTRLFATNGGAAVWTLDSAATRFGAYFGTNNPSAPDGTIQFFDAGGTLLFSDLLTVPNDCNWYWHGWDFGGQLVKRIEVRSNYSSGGYMMMDSVQADLLPGSVGTSVCACDGTGGVAPCGNAGGTGEGCSNSTGRGARLWASGLPSLGSGGLQLHADGLVPGFEGVYFEGSLVLNGGNGYLLGDGLRCAGSSVCRLEVVFSDAGGLSASSVDLRTAGSALPQPGVDRIYQLWYRDPLSGPCGFGFNTTNALRVTWQP